MGLLIAALAVAVLIWLLLLGLAKTAAAQQPTPRPTVTETTTVTHHYVTVTPEMVARLAGKHGPEEQAAARRELHDLAEWEAEA